MKYNIKNLVDNTIRISRDKGNLNFSKIKVSCNNF
jgi:hypothetical protein